MNQIISHQTISSLTTLNPKIEKKYRDVESDSIIVWVTIVNVVGFILEVILRFVLRNEGTKATPLNMKRRDVLTRTAKQLI